MGARTLLRTDDRGLRLTTVGGEPGFWIDPWKTVHTAVITHAHADHARPGMGRYFCAAPCEPLLRRRVHAGADITAVPYGKSFSIGGASLSFHPSGHCLGAAQVRVETAEGVAVAAGDYKRASDPTCEPFEVVPCDEFVTEATFALPIYRWRPTAETAAELLSWWDDCAEQGKAAILFCYALGKAQRVMGELHRIMSSGGVERATEPGRSIRTHGAVEPMLAGYRELGVELPATHRVAEGDRAVGKNSPFRGSLVIAPPSAAGSAWMRRFGANADYETGFASGWMRVRGRRRRGGYDRGFVISDHADWPDLVRTCDETGATRVLCTHGSSSVLAGFLNERARERGDERFRAAVLETAYEGEGGAERAGEGEDHSSESCATEESREA
ncbi:MAG: ligase-associated DNA damage response exonuclease [Planctomycetota bacterium]